MMHSHEEKTPLAGQGSCGASCCVRHQAALQHTAAGSGLLHPHPAHRVPASQGRDLLCAPLRTCRVCCTSWLTALLWPGSQGSKP